MRTPRTLIEAIRYFADADICRNYLAECRWPNGVSCPRKGCGSKEVWFIRTRAIWRCKSCRKQFSVKVGSIFEDSPIKLDKWLPAVWLLTCSSKGYSSHRLAKALGVTQKTAWFMLHRIRLARGETLQRAIRRNVESGAILYTDEAAGFRGLNADYAHEVINHSEEYVRGAVHTNGIESFWANFKRTVYGTHHFVMPWQLDRYLDDATFRFNQRKIGDGGRFALALAQSDGWAQTYV